MSIPIFVDSFDRPNNTDLGNNWLVCDEVWRGGITNTHGLDIHNNVASHWSGATVCANYRTAESYGPDQFVEALVWPDYITGLGLRFTKNGSGDYTGYYVQVDHGSTRSWIGKFTNTTNTLLYNTPAFTWPTASPFVLRFEVVGTAFRVLCDGVVAKSFTDSSYGSGGPMIMSADGNSEIRWFRAGNVASVPGNIGRYGSAGGMSVGGHQWS